MTTKTFFIVVRDDQTNIDGAVEQYSRRFAAGTIAWPPKNEPKPSRREAVEMDVSGSHYFAGPGLLCKLLDGLDQPLSITSCGFPNGTPTGFRVALLADLHANSLDAADFAASAIQMAIDQKPDLDCNSGRLRQHERSPDDSLRPSITGAASRCSPCPIVATLGNTTTITATTYPGSFLSSEILRPCSSRTGRLTFKGSSPWRTSIDDAIFHKHRTEFLADGSFSKVVIDAFPRARFCGGSSYWQRQPDAKRP